MNNNCFDGFGPAICQKMSEKLCNGADHCKFNEEHNKCVAVEGACVSKNDAKQIAKIAGINTNKEVWGFGNSNNKTSMGGRRVRSNKGKKRGPYGPRTGRTRSGKRYKRVSNKTRKVGRKTRSNKGKKRGPYGPRTGKTRTGKKFRGGDVTCYHKETGLGALFGDKCGPFYVLENELSASVKAQKKNNHNNNNLHTNGNIENASHAEDNVNIHNNGNENGPI